MYSNNSTEISNDSLHKFSVQVSLKMKLLFPVQWLRLASIVHPNHYIELKI